MCTSKGIQRDWRQVRALLYRYTTVLRKQKAVLFGVIYPSFIVLCCYLVAAYSIYQPQELQMKATEQYHVTSTDTSMDFIDLNSGFVDELSLHNCTLRNRNRIGIVRQDREGNESESGFKVLMAIFNDIADRYSEATAGKGVAPMQVEVFATHSDLHSYVKAFDYYDHMLCFAFMWDVFNPAEHQFDFEISMNFGEILSTRLPQTEYEEAPQNQLYLDQYAETGMLQTMTTATKKLLQEVYEKPEDSFKFDVMYMPMDSGTFQNDLFSEVVTALAGLTMLAFANIGPRTLNTMDDPDEKRIQDALRRAGMRKSVEATLEFIITMVVLPLVIPLMALFTQSQVVPTTSWDFIFVQFVIFTFRVIFQSWVIRFVIDNHVYAEVVEVVLEVLGILMTIYAQLLVKIDPTFTIVASFFLPLLYITQSLRLSVIASNRNITVELFQPNLIVNRNDLTKIMWVSLGALFIKMAILLYTLPFKIFNDPKELWGPTYLCRPRFWKSLCRSAPTEEEAAGTGALNTSLETSLVRDSGEGTQIDLHEDEKKMIEQGFWEQPKHIPLSGTPYMRLDRINVEHNGHHLVHNLSLTAFPGEIIVLIGENGSGKSSMVRTIAGLEHVHSGTATAFGIDLFKAFRFMKDNFMTFTCTDPILIDLLTPEQHLHIFNSFLGLENDPKTIMNILSTYKLLSVAKIATIKLSRQNKKMLCFALAMLGNSKLVLLDDPMEGMDAAQKRLVQEVIHRNKNNRIILITTQDMKSASALGNRIGFVSHGQIKLLGSPKFFAQKFKHSLQIQFTLQPVGRLIKLRALKELIKSSAKSGQVFDEIEIKNESLIVKLPPGTSYQTLHQCIDMNKVNAQQGKLFEYLQIKSQSLSQTFNKMVEFISEHGGDDSHGHGHGGDKHGGSHDSAQGNFESQVSLLDVGTFAGDGSSHQMQKVGVTCSTAILLRKEFACKKLFKQLLVIFCSCLLVMGQETAAIFFLTQMEQPVIQYTDVEQTFEEQHPPVLVFANEKTASGAETTQLFDRFKSIVNEDGDAVMLETFSWEPEGQSSVKETFTKVAEFYYEEMEHFVEEENLEAFGAYYVYDLDPSKNQYAIGVMGNQLAAASCPTWGATMLQTLAQEVSGEQKLKLGFRNKLLYSNNRLLPQYKPIIAEVYGTSILAATLVTIIFHVRIFGKPINTGFYSAFLASGGHRFSYIFSKYLKAVCANLIMSAICLTLMYGQKFHCMGLVFFLILWSLINPLYVAFLTVFNTLVLKLDVEYLVRQFMYIQSLMAVLALTMSATLLYSTGFGEFLPFFFTFALNPSVLLFMASQFGFIYDRLVIKKNQDVYEIYLDIWHNYVYLILLGYMFVSMLLSVFLLHRQVTLGTRAKREGCFVMPRIVPKLQIDEVDADVQAEHQKALDCLKSSVNHILVVENLQTFEYFHRDMLYETAAHGSYVGSIYFHDNYTRGNYTTKGVSFSLEHTERFVILDACKNGAEDLFAAIAGQKVPLCGNMVINGLCGDDLVSNYTKLHGIIGFQPQYDAVDENLTVHQHLTIFAGIAGIPRSECETHVLKMIQALILGDKSDTQAGELTHGQLRRLTLGMALIGRPKLVVLSSPLEGLDPHTKNKILDTIIAYTEGRALLMSTIDSEVAQRIGHRVGIMHEGKMVAIGPVSHILKTHSSGLSIEVQANMEELAAHKPQGLEGEFGFVETHDEARDILDCVQAQMDEQSIMVGCDNFESQYHTKGMLKSLFDQVASPESTVRSKFIEQLLVLNLAMSIFKVIDEDHPHLQVKISSIEADLIHFQLNNVNEDFDIAHFSELTDEMTRDLAISYFIIAQATLASVHAKLVSDLYPDKNAQGDDEECKNLFLARQRTVFGQTQINI